MAIAGFFLFPPLAALAAALSLNYYRHTLRPQTIAVSGGLLIALTLVCAAAIWRSSGSAVWVMGGILIQFAAAELILRLTLTVLPPPRRIYRFHPFLAYEIIPNTSRVNGISHNNHGFRGPAIDTVKPAGTTRIFLVGGSTTYDAAGPEGSHTADFLSAHLTAKFPGKRFEVLNAGVDGYNSLQSLIVIASRLVDYAPDFIVVMHGANDAAIRLLDGYRSDYASVYKPFIYPAARFWERSAILSMALAGRNNFDNRWFPNVVNSLQAFTFIDRLMKYALGNGAFSEETKGNLVANSTWAFERNTLSIIALSRIHSFRLALCSLPHVTPSDRGAAIDAQNRILREMCATHGIPVVDLAEAFSWHQELFCDEIHMNAAGQKLKSSAIADMLEKLI